MGSLSRHRAGVRSPRRITTKGSHYSGVTPGVGRRVPGCLRPRSLHLDPVQEVAAAVDGSGEVPGVRRRRGLRRPRGEWLFQRLQRLGLRRRLGVGGRGRWRGGCAPQPASQLHPKCQPQPQPEAPDPPGAEWRQPGALMNRTPPTAPGAAPGGRGPGRHGRQKPVHGVSGEPAASELPQAGQAAEALEGMGGEGKGAGR